MTGSYARKPHAHSRAIALFGGTFDPFHSGHLAVAQAAQRRFRLDAVYFIPSSRPPHKTKRELALFVHRYAMVALGCAGHPGFFPSLAEAGAGGTGQQVFYSIDTVRRFRRQHPRDHLFFILGADSFLEIATWRSHKALLDSCDFIVASRPGFRLEALRIVIPAELLGRPPAADDGHTITLRKTAVHLLPTVRSHVSSTEIRGRLKRGQSIHGLVPQLVEEYILRQALYR